ncbi:MAG TPA: MaoC family dehydratase [Dermatophilaceae bacterium]|nr:MaoC family dehydratase [Dermatophilaceae bacterium]
MTREIVFETAPDLRRILARALLRRGSGGETVPDVRVVRRRIRIDVDHVLDYARVCGFTVAGSVPLTYPHLLVFPLQVSVMTDRAFPIPLMGSVHVQNVIRSTRAIAADEVLDTVVWAENLRPHRRGRQVDLVSEVSSGGEVVWREVSTYFARGTEHPDAPRSGAPDLVELEAVSTGPTWRLPEGIGRAYAAVSGDWNPIHLHTLTAKPLGSPGVIAHGMYTYARVLAALGPKLPADDVTSHVWFRKPLGLPATVRVRSVLSAHRTLSLVESARGDRQHAVIENTW